MFRNCETPGVFALRVLALSLLQDATHRHDPISSVKENLLDDGVADTLVSLDTTAISEFVSVDFRLSVCFSDSYAA